MEPKFRLEMTVPRRSLEDFTAQRSGRGMLFVPTHEPVRAGDPVLVSVHFEGFPHEFSMEGGVTAVRLQGRGTALPPGATVSIEKSHLPRLEKALAFARGEKVDWHRRRHPRYPTSLSARVRTAFGLIEARLRDLSLGGARLDVDGELPSIGETIELIFKGQAGILPLRIQARVLWLDFFRASRGFGVEFVEGGRSMQRRLVRLIGEEIAPGAPPV